MSAELDGDLAEAMDLIVKARGRIEDMAQPLPLGIAVEKIAHLMVDMHLALSLMTSAIVALSHRREPVSPEVLVLPKLGPDDTLIVKMGSLPGEMTDRAWVPTHADVDAMQETVMEITGHPKVLVTHRWTDFVVAPA